MSTEGMHHDLNALREITGGDAEFETMMISTFCKEAPLLVESMASAHRSGDLITMGRQAHSLKPNAQMFGITDIHEDILYVELAGKEEQNKADLSEKIERIQSVILQVVSDLS